MITLRDFLYLNSKMLENYLSSVEGFLEDEIDHTETEKIQKGGKADAKVVSGNITSETSTESKSKRVLTEPAKFQRLYEALENIQQLKYLDLFDDKLWSEINRGDILEVQAKMQIPSVLTQMEQLQEFMPYLDLMENLGESFISDSDRLPLQGFLGLQKILKDKPLPIIFQAATTPGFNFVTHLSREYLLCEFNQLQGEAVIFGKVQRILPAGQKLEIVNLIPDMLSMPNMNREQRRKLQSNKNKSAQAKFIETIKGPAIVLTALAIYQ